MAERAPISERVNELIPANTAAMAMSLQIPTFYKYMAYYDQGILKPIPELVMGFLKLVDGGCDADAAREYLENHVSRRQAAAESADIQPRKETSAAEELMRRIEGTRSAVKLQEDSIAENQARIAELRSEVARLQAEHDADPGNADKRMRLDVEQRNIESIESQIEKLREMRGRMMSELDTLSEEYETVTGGEIGKRWTTGDIRTLSIGDGSRSTIFFDNPLGGETVVEITIDTPYGMLKVADLIPAEGCNYVAIDDIVPAANISYEVVETCGGQELRSGRFKVQFE